MFEITTSTSAANAKGAPGLTVECLLSETMTVWAPGLAGILVKSGPADGVTMNGPELTFSRPGRYRFAIATLHLGLGDLHVCVCQDECMQRLPNGDGADGQTRHARRILRSLANGADWFTGRASELVNRPLAPYGA
jgi:hypothetical protein